MRILLLALLLFSSLASAQGQGSFTIEPPSSRVQRSLWYTTIPVRPIPAYVAARVLAASTAESVTVPSWARFAVFSADCNFQANWNGTATVAADNDTGTASEMNPAAWYFDAGRVSAISVISATTCNLTVSFGQ